jgi:eukaryotic-like serine/threonine-protein kinase
MVRAWWLALLLSGCGERAAAKPACPADMVLVPAGKFTMGHAKWPYASPLHEVTFTRAFCIDRHEVTVEAYARCIEAGACSAPREWLFCNFAKSVRELKQHPQNCIDWHQSRAYCEWAKRRLPTEPEWEYAARGPEGRKYPWGDEEPDANRMHWGGAGGKRKAGTTAVGTHRGDVSPFGVLDMAGNVSEWVEFPPEQLEWDADAAAAGERRPVKGDSWPSGQDAKPSWVRWILDASGHLGQSGHRGARCAVSPELRSR